MGNALFLERNLRNKSSGLQILYSGKSHRFRQGSSIAWLDADQQEQAEERQPEGLARDSCFFCCRDATQFCDLGFEEVRDPWASIAPLLLRAVQVGFSGR